jgi:hypothetical protein
VFTRLLLIHHFVQIASSHLSAWGVGVDVPQNFIVNFLVDYTTENRLHWKSTRS